MSLNEDQGLVANSTDHTLVCAGPGTGKTHTSITLADNLLAVPGNSMIMVTFTRNGADELQERLQRKLPESSLSRVKADTFHSLMLVLYRRAKLPLKVIMGADQYNLIKAAIRQFDSSLMEDYMDITQSIDKLGRAMDSGPSDLPLEHQEINKVYLKLCEKYRKIDMNGASKLVIGMLETGQLPTFRASHMLIDEYQDTDPIQYRWAKIHGENGTKIITIGDDDQSIYSFRSALGFKGMELFQSTFDADAYVLRTCYRCHEEILYAAMSLIEKNTHRVPKRLNSALGRGGRVDIIDVIEANNEIEQIIKKATEVEGSWAVLARNRKLLDTLEAHIKESGLTYKRLDSKNILDNPEIESCMRLLGSLEFKNNTHSVIDSLMFLQEDESNIETIKNYLSSNRQGFEFIAKSDFGSCSKEVMDLSVIWGDLKQDTSDVTEIKRRCTSLLKIIWAAKEVTPDKQGKIFQVFMDMFSSWALKKGWNEAVSLCNYMLKNRKNIDDKVYDIVLGTMHSSKGLEFDNVWLMAMNEAVCPGGASTTEEIEEERRLVYVGMTRAKKYLALSYYKEKISFFLNEIDYENVNRIEMRGNS